MTPQSSKAKGRRGQQIVRDATLEAFPQLEPDDVRSTAMGQNGADLLLSPAARRLLPYDFEIKNKARSETHAIYSQAKTHGNHEPIAVIKKGRDIPLAVISLEHFLSLLKRKNNNED